MAPAFAVLVIGGTFTVVLNNRLDDELELVGRYYFREVKM